MQNTLNKTFFKVTVLFSSSFPFFFVFSFTLTFSHSSFARYFHLFFHFYFNGRDLTFFFCLSFHCFLLFSRVVRYLFHFLYTCCLVFVQGSFKVSVWGSGSGSISLWGVSLICNSIWVWGFFFFFKMDKGEFRRPGLAVRIYAFSAAGF